MNSTERRMVEILTKLKQENGVVSVKAEFEAEGTRIDELQRLADVTRTAGLSLAVKIGGCEAIRDLIEAKQFGVRYVIAPMVETAYAASKFVGARNIVFQPEDRADTDFLINIETITGYDNREGIFDTIAGKDGLSGVVLGRVDFTGSLGWGREAINEQRTTDFALDLAARCRASGKQLVVGGGVAHESLDALRQIATVHLDRFETRKIIFDANIALASDIESGLTDAVEFELLWLENKRDYYTGIAIEDAKRIAMLSSRHSELIRRK